MSVPLGLPHQFICWKLTADKRKLPCLPDGTVVDAHDPKNWCDYETAKSSSYDVGFVLTADDPWFCIDLDKCRPNGEWSEEAKAIYDSFPGAWGETSQSGEGRHIMGKCEKSQLLDRKNKFEGWIEFYITGRYIAFGPTGFERIANIQDDKDWTEHLKNIVPQRTNAGGQAVLNGQTGEASELPSGRDPRYNGPDDDEVLIAKALRSKSTANHFGQGVSFADLWNANLGPLGKKYPAFNTNDPFDHSSADAALMAHLAFWTGKDAQRMDRLFRRSKLMRKKWETRPDYRKRTINVALGHCTKVYSGAHSSDDSQSVLHKDMSHDELARHIYNGSWAGEMLYIPEEGRWAVWDGSRWVKATSKIEPIKRLRKNLRNIPTDNDVPARKRLGDKNTIMAIDFLMRSNVGACRDLADWDSDPFMLGTPSSVVDLCSGTVKPRGRRDFLLCSTSVDPAPSSSPPVAWLSFIDTITGGDKELAEFLQRLSGYAATGSTKEQKMFFAFGAGRNGKSTWLNVLLAILTDHYGRTISPKLLVDKRMEQHPTDLAHLMGARLARASEIPVGKSWDETLIKQITGGDKITARRMRQDNFTFIPKCTLIVDANHAPTIKGVDEAIRRRMCVIPFNVTIRKEDVDPDLFDKLMREAPAILRWIIEGAVKWYHFGLTIPDAVRIASEDYIESEDIFGTFLEDHSVDDPAGRVSNSKLYGTFNQFIEAMGQHAWTNNAVSKEMKKRGYETYKSGSERGFKGLTLIPSKPTMRFP